MKKSVPMTSEKSILPTGLCLEWRNLNYYVPATEQNNYSFWQKCQKKKELRILRDVSGHLRTGDLIAILGCSGAGKTTLLAAISQRLRGSLTGDFLMNGMAVKRDDMIRISSFLPQFEINVKTFTSFEHLYFMSHFKMNRNTTKEEKQQRVSDLLLAVGLRDASNTRIQNLSGGERKRLSLAEELITDPPFLFCDEPTTGLDSYSAYTVIKTLRHLCTRHRVPKTSIASIYGEDSFSTSSENSSNTSIEMDTMNSEEQFLTEMNGMRELTNLNVLNNTPNGNHKKAAICSIHQPTSEIFELFTHVVLMDNGRIIFQGTTERATELFEEMGYGLPHNVNPADYYLKVISDSHTNRNDGDIIKARYDSENDGRYSGSWLTPRTYSGDYMYNLRNFQKIRWIHQVYLLLKRIITEDSRRLRSSFVNMGFFMITSVTLAIMYSGIEGLTQTSIQDMNGSIFMIGTEIIFTFSYSVTYVFPALLPIMRREVGEGTYSLSAFFVAVALSFVPAAFFKSYVFFAVVYGAIYASRGFLLYLSMGLALSLASVAATAYGLFLSSLFESDKMASECAAPFDLVFLIFGGAYYNVESIPLLKYISLFFYANEALLFDFWKDVDTIECSTNLEHPCVHNGTEVLLRASFQTASYTYWLDCLGLVMATLVFNICAYFFVRKYVRRSGYY